MSFNEKDLLELSNSLKQRLSEERYRHTLGVERAALALGKYCLSSRISQLRAAALLHDVAKELSFEKLEEILRQTDGITESDYLSPPVFHSLAAPFIIKNEYPRFATEDILRAVKYHTTASPDMSVFDEIIFVADFIEDTRSYSASRELREKLFSELSLSRSTNESIISLHRAVVWILDFTVGYLKSKNKYINERTVVARKELSQKYSDILTNGREN